MGLFGNKRNRRRPLSAAAPRPIVVTVKFRDLAETNIDLTPTNFGDYAFRWLIPYPPVVGQWVYVHNQYGVQTAIVTTIGENQYSREYGIDSLETISHLVPTEAIEQAKNTRSFETWVWLAHCRWSAGIDKTPPKERLPEGLTVPPLPNPNITDLSEADRYGRHWWRAYRESENLKHPPELIEKVRQVALDWYAIRDRLREPNSK